MTSRIPIRGFLKNKGFSDEEISELPSGALSDWERVLNMDPIDQDSIKKFLNAKVFMLSQELAKPRNLWQSLLGMFGVDPNRSYLLAMLNISVELFKLMDYDPQEALRQMSADLDRRAIGK